MARFSTSIPNWTPAATADTTNLADDKHHTLRGGSTTQICELRDVILMGLNGSSAPTIMVLGRTSQIGTGSLTGTVVRLAAVHFATADLAAMPIVYAAAATNKPQRSATLGMLLGLAINTFGGQVRWANGPDEIVALVGNTASGGELSLNAFTGGTVGALQSTIVFEAL